MTVFQDVPKEALKQGNTDFMSLWAGQWAAQCQALPAAVLLKELDASIREMEKMRH